MKQLTNYLVLIFLLLIVAYNVKSQELPYLWSHKYGSSDFDISRGIVQDDDGNVITVGRFKGTVDFDPGAGSTSFTSQGHSGFVQKLNGSGDLVWVKEFLTSSSNRWALPQAAVTDASGNVYVAGHFFGSTDFQPGAGSNILSGIDYDGFLLKLDVDGDVQWVKQFEGSSEVNLNDLILDASGNIYVVGTHSGTVDLDPGTGTNSATATSGRDRLLLVKLDSNGNYIFGYSTIESTNMDVYDVELDSDGDIFIAGHFFSSTSVQFAEATAFNTTSVSIGGFVVSIDGTTEERISFTKFDGTGSDYATSISFNSSGEMFVGGYFEGDIDLNPGASTWNYTSNGGEDGFIARFSSFGSFSRGARVGGSSDDRVIKVIAEDDVVHAIGSFQGTVNMNPYDQGTPSNKTATATDGFSWTLNSLASVLTLNRVQVFSSTGNVVMSDFVRTASSETITGGFYGTLDADPSASASSHTASGSSSDIFQVRLSNNSNPSDIALTNNSIDENNSVDATIGTLSSTDSDVGDTHSYSLVSGAGDTDNASFNIDGNNLRIGIASDHEVKDSYSVRIQTSDDNGGVYSEAFPILINDIPEAPTNVTLTSYSINENNSTNATIGTISATDPDDGDSHTYALVTGTGDTDNTSFNISGTTLTIGVVSDHEVKDTYNIRIQATDSNGEIYSEAISISIGDVNEAPTNLSLKPSSIDENSSGLVGSFSITDEDDGDTFTLSLVKGTGSTNNGSFSISRSSLLLTNAADYEQDTELYIRVRATDLGGLTFEKDLIVSINDVSEAPTDISLSNNQIDENEASNTTIGILSTTDVDAGEVYSYSLVNGTGDTDNASFIIVGQELRSNAVFDFEIKSTYAIRVNTNDLNGGNFEKSFTITVNDIAEFITWNGTTWSNGTGPGAGSDDVIIDGDYNMGTNGYFDSRDLTINSGATLTVDGESSLVIQQNLINNGSIVVESGSSLMVNSPNTIMGNDITFRRNTRYADGRYSFVGSPVEQDVSIVGSDLGSHVYKYNETTAYGADGINRWEDASADELIPGKGYTQAFQQEIVFSGIPNQGTITIDGTFTDVADPDHEGWVLVSNPYPAPIDVADFLSGNTNTTGTIYIWDDNGSDTQRGTNADYIVANGSMVTNTTPTPAGGASRYDQIMGSMQGFFVKLTSAADVEIEFNESMRVTGNSDDHFFRKTQIPIARINLTSSDGLFRQAVIGLSEDANNTELNRTYDAQPFSAIASDGLFTIKEGRSLSLNGMTRDWEVIQLQVNTAIAGNYEIAVELEAYDQSLYLRDNLTGEVTDLRNESYSFSAQSGINTDRFELLSSPSGVLGLENNDLLVYAHQSILHIHQQDGEAREYQLFNMNGQKLLTQSVKGKAEINVSSYSKGIYLVFDGEKTHKIILK